MSEKVELWSDIFQKWKHSADRQHLIDDVANLLATIRLEDKTMKILLVPKANGFSFFDEPASTIHHNNTLGGLAKHSLTVFKVLIGLAIQNEKIKDAIPYESIVKTSLLHDYCKWGSYQPNLSVKKTLLTKPFEIKDTYPMGHGEKSVILLMKDDWRLTDLEMILIRWHMGPFDRMYNEMQSYLAKAYPYHLALYLADQAATMMDGEK